MRISGLVCVKLVFWEIWICIGVFCVGILLWVNFLFIFVNVWKYIFGI